MNFLGRLYSGFRRLHEDYIEPRTMASAIVKLDRVERAFLALRSELESRINSTETASNEQFGAVLKSLVQIGHTLNALRKELLMLSGARNSTRLEEVMTGVVQVGQTVNILREKVLPNNSIKLDEVMTGVVQVGHTVNILREEVLLVLNRPSQPDASETHANDSGLLRDFIKASRMRELYPTDLFPGLDRISMAIGAINEESEHANQVDLLYVSAIAKYRGCRRMFEFGTYQGRTTYHLTFASENARVFTLNLPPDKDPPVAEFLGSWFKGTDRERFITQILEDSRSFDPTPYEHQMDFVFVDADHTYEGVKNDSEKALRLLAPGGILVWHDFAAKSPGVVRYIKDFSQDRPVFRLKHTCLVVYIDGMDVERYAPPSRRASWLSRRQEA